MWIDIFRRFSAVVVAVLLLLLLFCVLYALSASNKYEMKREMQWLNNLKHNASAWKWIWWIAPAAQWIERAKKCNSPICLHWTKKKTYLLCRTFIHLRVYGHFTSAKWLWWSRTNGKIKISRIHRVTATEMKWFSSSRRLNKWKKKNTREEQSVPPSRTQRKQRQNHKKRRKIEEKERRHPRRHTTQVRPISVEKRYILYCAFCAAQTHRKIKEADASVKTKLYRQKYAQSEYWLQSVFTVIIPTWSWKHSSEAAAKHSASPFILYRVENSFTYFEYQQLFSEIAVRRCWCCCFSCYFVFVFIHFLSRCNCKCIRAPFNSKTSRNSLVTLFDS